MASEPTMIDQLELAYGFDGSVRLKLRCAGSECGSEYQHLKSVYMHPSDDYDSTKIGSTRGAEAVLTFFCEGCETITGLSVGQHKGETFLELKDVTGNEFNAHKLLVEQQ